MRLFTAAALMFLCVLSCAVRPPLTVDTARGALAGFVRVNDNDVDSLRGGGSVEFSQNGEHGTIPFDIRWAGDTCFLLEFSTPLGTTLASIRSGGNGKLTIAAGDSQYDVRTDQTISIGQGFLQYPLTWGEFLSIITCRLPCLSAFSRTPDSIQVDKKSMALIWKTASCAGQPVDISASVDNKTHCLSEISYVPRDAVGSFFARGFAQGYAKEFRFVQSNNNYFYVTYHSVTIHRTARKRKAF